MAKYCGGVSIDTNTLKIINGVICPVGVDVVDVSKAVTTCGQLWDGNSFKVLKLQEQRPCLTSVQSVAINNYIKSNCGILFDADCFEKDNQGRISLK